jgi:pimeloyl-ACP methyl ester carboxylesterase
LCAPVKRLVWFEKSAHNVPFEEPRLFNATVVRELQSIGVRLSAAEGVQRK